jgi:hypothetical protein
MLSTAGEIVQDLLMIVGAVVVLLVGIIVLIVKMPARSPLKRTLTALCFRLGATALAAALAIPIEPIPGLDVLYDIGAPIALLAYWISFFKNARWNTRPDPGLGSPPSNSGRRGR